jgi:ParB family chromosome partitioning protein
MPQQRARLNTDQAKHQLGLNIGSPILAEIAGAKGGQTAQEQRIEQVPIDLIRPNPFQPRRDFDDDGLQELADVMKSMGFFGALLGRRQQRHIELAYGERRVRAARMAGIQEIPIELRQLSDMEMFNVAVVENEQRRDLTQLEVGEAFLRAKEQFGLSERDIAERLGKSKGYVRNRIETAQLPDDLKERLRKTPEEQFSASHARELARIEDESTRRILTERVINDNRNYQQTKLAVEQTLGLREQPGGVSSPGKLSVEEQDELLEKLVQPLDKFLQQRESPRGIDRLRVQADRLLQTAKQLASDERIDRQELRVVLDQIYVSIYELSSELS